MDSRTRGWLQVLGWGVGPRHKGREFEAWLKLTHVGGLSVLAILALLSSPFLPVPILMLCGR